MPNDEIAQEIAEALMEVGEEVGNGPLVVQFLPFTAGNPDVFPKVPPGYGKPVDVVAMKSTFRIRDAGGSLTSQIVQSLMIEAVRYAPSKNDKLKISGKDYTIVEILPFEPAGVALYYDVQVEIVGSGK